MRLTVLGCQSPFPAADGATIGYLLEVGGKRILMDCGSGVLAQLAKKCKPYELDLVLISHLHHDHISDFFVLQYALLVANQFQKRNQPLSVWAPSEPKGWFEKLSYRNYILLQAITEGKTVSLEGVNISFFLTDHAVPCYAMKIEYDGKVLLYGADAGPRTDWTRMAIEPDLFICEASFLHKDLPADPIGHLSAKQAAQAANQIKARRLLLTHLYPELDPLQLKQEAEQEYHQELLVAEIGLEINL
ncbi:MBL fold metallo-hydrolase [Thermoflavimicrobium dichotomicum]|uniref:Ribonuclease BN, tRNA processing enzyme n=1 Tax=Thermoflavimicrobium dichotomicum TaxID=46223 RepID=A0A1I3PW75_9BACL|nr:MBL fold metallo-hydrolase [Thermoflavimicrobium dichotomicum]SFJ25527.1 Ribonuclease BN, tRNA processing enzyme [Thermoflavimicrobium dichotomicum]